MTWTAMSSYLMFINDVTALDVIEIKLMVAELSLWLSGWRSTSRVHSQVWRGRPGQHLQSLEWAVTFGSGGVAFLWCNQQPVGSAVVERTLTTSLGMSRLSTSVPDDSPSSTTVQTTPYPPFSLSLLASSLMTKEELWAITTTAAVIPARPAGTKFTPDR